MGSEGDGADSGISCSRCGHVLAGDFHTPISPVPQLINTVGIPPSDKERQDIRNTISQTEQDIYLIYEDIDRLEGVLSSLVRKLGALEQHLQTHKNLLSPIQKLPVEILSEIFLCVHDPFSWHIHDDLSLLKTAMLPGQVCHSWRTVALTTPELWSSIILPITRRMPTSIFKLTSTRLERSGGSPLSLAINGALTEHGDIHPLLDTIAAASHRWKHIDLDQQLFQYDVLRKAKENLPVLESLTLSHYQGHGYAWARDVFESAPRLRTVVLLKGIQVNEIALPWHQLTHLELSVVMEHELLSLLQKCPNLQECIVSVNSWGSSSDPSMTYVRHDSLRSLNINVLHNLQSFTCPLDFLELPTLSTLCCTDRDDPDAPDRLTEFIARSSPTLLHLNLTMGYLTSESIVHIFQLTPLLETVSLRGPSGASVTREVLIRLTAGDPSNADHGVLLPNLWSFGLDDLHHLCDRASFADMVESRWRQISLIDPSIPDHTTGLRRVFFNFEDVFRRGLMDLDTFCRFKCFRDEGLRILTPNWKKL